MTDSGFPCVSEPGKINRALEGEEDGGDSGID